MNICIADNIKTLRRKNDYTLEQLAEIIDVSRQTIAKWEMGETLPDIINCVKLATLFKVTLDEFVTMQTDLPDKIHTDKKNDRVMGVTDIGTDGQIHDVEGLYVRDMMLGASLNDLEIRYDDNSGYYLYEDI